MENYNKKLDVLFENWEKKSIENGYDRFCRDGLMCKGEIYDEKWDLRSQGNENELWYNAPKRVLFLCKDPNIGADYPVEDFRERNCHKKGENIKVLFYKNMAYWLYGLLNVDNNGIAPKFETLTDEIITDFFDKTPFAYVNCKKEAGVEKVSNTDLQNHIDLYKDFIKQEIEILNPDIIVCGGGSSIIKNFVKEIYTDIEKINDSNNWIYYSKKNNKVVIDSYHPSYWQIEGGSKTIYEDMMSKYKEFIDKYPHFLKNNTR